MRIATAIALMLSATLAGCVTAEEQRAADEARCLDYGFDPGSSAYADCRLQLDLDRRETIRSNSIALQTWSTPLIVYPGYGPYYGRHYYHRGPYHRRYHRHYRRH